MSFLFDVIFMKKPSNNPIIPTVPTNIAVAINGTVATFSFAKGTNAISTEFVVDGTTYSTDATTLVVDIGAYAKTFTYKAISKSSTGDYSAYTAESTSTTGNKPVTNIFNSNFLPYDSSTNINGIVYSSYATGDTTNKTITHTTTSFSSSYGYVFTGFTAGKQYKYSVDLSGSLTNIFLKANCLSSTGSQLSSTSEVVNATQISFTVPTGTTKIQIFVGTTSGHVGSTTFGNLRVEEV